MQFAAKAWAKHYKLLLSVNASVDLILFFYPKEGFRNILNQQLFVVG